MDGHEIISSNFYLGGPSNISCINGYETHIPDFSELK